MKAHAVKENSSGNCFLGVWCEDGYRMRSIGSSSTEDLRSKALSCHSDQKTEQGISLARFFLF